MNGPNLEERLDRVETHVRNIDLRLQRVEQILPTLATKDDLKGMPTVDDPKGFATKEDLRAELRNYPTRAEVDAMFAREGEVMRTFVLEVVEKSAADTRHEMRVLFERQQTWFHTMLDAIGSVREDLRQVDAGSRARDAALDERLRRLERP
jgi:hypothetical protein